MLFITYLGIKDIHKRSDNALTKNEVIEKINNFLIDEFEIDISVITPDADLRDTLHLGSLDYVDLMVLAERNFYFTLNWKDFINIKTFRDFYEFCHHKQFQS